MIIDNRTVSEQQYTGLMGRRVLTATVMNPADATEIARVLDNVMPLHLHNSREIDYLYWYYRGVQPILGRKKDIRPEIVNNVVENRAFEIVEFKKGYEFSHPIQYTNAGDTNSAPINILNTYARIDGKESKDLALAEWMYKCGTAYRLCLPLSDGTEDDAPYFTDVLDPRNTFVVYSAELGHKPIFACTYARKEILNNNGTNSMISVYGAYTENDYWEWVLPDGIMQFAQITPEHKPNPLGRIPIVEYPLNESRLGYVEICANLCDAINNVDSNRIDAIEQFVQAILVFVNCELPSDENDNPIMPSTGCAITIKSSNQSPADVKYIFAQLDQAQTQITKEDLLNAAYEICGVPDRKQRNGGGDTGQAVVLRDGWGAAEARAKSTEKLFKKSELEYLRIVLKICRDTVTAAESIGSITLKDIDVRFTRNRNDNMQVKAATLEMLLRNGVNPEDAYEYCEMFSDPVAVWRKSQKWAEDNNLPLPGVSENETDTMPPDNTSNAG